jgi:Putative DNA-binding domain
VNPLFARLGIPADVDTLAGIRRLVNERASETRHLDFKQQLHNVDDLADDLSALANVGGGVLIIGIGTDKVDRAAALYEQELHLVEQQAVQAARDGIDEPLRIEPVIVPGDVDPARGFLVIAVPPSDRIPHITVKRGRVLHRVGTHNKPMTRRELGAAFAAGGDLFTIEFGLTRGYGSTAVICELIESAAGMHNEIKIANTGTLPALDISIDSTTSEILWYKDAKRADDESRLSALFDGQNYVLDPPYLPIRNLPSGSDVILQCWREWGSPTQDVLHVTWRTPDGQVHRNEQSWSWTPRRRSRD